MLNPPCSRINFTTSFEKMHTNGRAYLEVRPKQIAMHYMKGWGPIDFAACFPFTCAWP